MEMPLSHPKILAGYPYLRQPKRGTHLEFQLHRLTLNQNRSEGARTLEIVRAPYLNVTSSYYDNYASVCNASALPLPRDRLGRLALAQATSSKKGRHSRH